jgi:hypothetical protein
VDIKRNGDRDGIYSDGWGSKGKESLERDRFGRRAARRRDGDALRMNA